MDDAPIAGRAPGVDLPAGEWTRLSPRLWWLRVTELSVVGVLAVLVVALVAPSAHRGAVVLIALAALIVLVGLLVVFNRRRFRAWGYLEREDDLLVRRGVLVQRLSVVPYGRMQLVEVTAGVFERLFGLSTVKLHTAAARSDARIPGLEPDEAARLRDRLAALGEAQAAGL
jgi:membrane protein YdbS with pleckstrin-like domain